MMLLKKVYNAKIKKTEDEIPDITNLGANASLHAKTNEVKSEMLSITNELLMLPLMVK